MASYTLEQTYTAARGYLNDTAVSGGEIFTDSVLQPSFNEPYRTMFGNLLGVSKRVQRTVYVNFPVNNTYLIPSGYGITDFSEPEVIEERQASTAITISATGTTSPISVTATGHGLGSAGAVVEGVVSQVAGTFAPWGRWFATVVDANTFTLNGSVTDGVAGTGGFFCPWTQLPFSEVLPIDLNEQGIDGVPQQYLGLYLWAEERLQFRGATQTQQLRITYWASGDPPTNVNTVIGIDNCIDFLACATAANAARSKGWFTLADQLRTQAYGSGSLDSGNGGLLGKFLAIQVATMQRGPQRRRDAFRTRRSRWGTIYLVN